jgi:predicted  nucleic acid-binding Zn-ribbon protein
MSESRSPEESSLVTTLLRENIQDLHQDIRELRQESRQHALELQATRRELKQDIQDLSLKMDARFSRLTTTLIATVAVLVAAMGVMTTMLRS